MIELSLVAIASAVVAYLLNQRMEQISLNHTFSIHGFDALQMIFLWAVRDTFTLIAILTTLGALMEGIK